VLSSQGEKSHFIGRELLKELGAYMENFAWKDKYSVHVDEMDRHHKKILEYLAEIQGKIQSDDSDRKVGETLKALIDYADFHFSEEERLMRAMDYFELTTQINQHAYFTEEVREMTRQFDLRILPGRSVVGFLRDWFINHILHEDYKYGVVMKRGKPLI